MEKSPSVNCMSMKESTKNAYVRMEKVLCVIWTITFAIVTDKCTWLYSLQVKKCIVNLAFISVSGPSAECCTKRQQQVPVRFMKDFFFSLSRKNSPHHYTHPFCGFEFNTMSLTCWGPLSPIPFPFHFGSGIPSAITVSVSSRVKTFYVRLLLCHSGTLLSSIVRWS